MCFAEKKDNANLGVPQDHDDQNQALAGSLSYDYCGNFSSDAFGCRVLF